MQQNNLDDQTLMFEIKAGNELAYSELFSRYGEYFKAQAYYMLRDFSLAEEAVNDVMISIWQRRKDIKIRKNVRAYLHSAVKKQCLLKIRNLKNHHDTFLLTDFFGLEFSHYATSSCRLETKELNQMIDLAIEHISSDSGRKAFIMFVMDDASHKEIARELNTSPGAVKQMIHRGAKVVRLFLKKYL